jgi:hypothetical protein
MTPRRAYEIASQWGSFNAIGDPGACFYSFPVNDGRPVDAAHRAECLAYLETRLLPYLAHESEIHRPETIRGREVRRDRRELLALWRWFKSAPDAGGNRPVDMRPAIPTEGVPT